jgi:hypothetical protein
MGLFLQICFAFSLFYILINSEFNNPAVNSERLPGEKGMNARAGLFIFDISNPAEPRQVGFHDMPGSGPHRFGVDNARKLAFLPKPVFTIRKKGLEPILE